MIRYGDTGNEINYTSRVELSETVEMGPDVASHTGLDGFYFDDSNQIAPPQPTQNNPEAVAPAIKPKNAMINQPTPRQDIYQQAIRPEPSPRQRTLNQGLARLLGGELPEQPDIVWPNPANGNRNVPFQANISANLPAHKIRRIENFLSTYEDGISDYLSGRRGSGESDENKVQLRFVDNNGIAHAVWEDFKHETSSAKTTAEDANNVKKFIGATASSVKGAYSKKDKRITVNMEQKSHQNDDALFETVIHELTHYKDDQEGKKLNRPKLARAARFIGELAVFGLGLHTAHRTNIGPEIASGNLADPVIVYAGWRLRKVGSAVATMTEYYTRPSEIKARREAKRVTAKHF